MSWMYTRTDGFDYYVNVRATMLDDPRWVTPFVETWTSEKLPWATTPAVHSYPGLPAVEDYERLVKEYAEHARAAS